MTTPAPYPEEVTLPTWSDATSVATYLTTLFGLVIAAIVGFHPGFTIPSGAATSIPLAAFVIASVAQLVNLARHGAAQVSAIKARTVRRTYEPVSSLAQAEAVDLSHVLAGFVDQVNARAQK